MTRVYVALGDIVGVLEHRRGALERVELLLEDWRTTRERLADVERRMTGVLDDLELTDLVTSIRGRTRLTGAGRPGLRLAAWRAVWGAQRANPVYAARFRHLTTRQHNKLAPSQARAVIAVALLRQLHAVVVSPADEIAAHGTATARPGRRHAA